MVYGDIMAISGALPILAAYGTTGLIMGRKFSLTRICIVSLLLSTISTYITLIHPYLASPVTALILLIAGTLLSFGKLSLRDTGLYSLITLALALGSGGLRLATEGIPWVIPLSLMYGIIISGRKRLIQQLKHPGKIINVELHRGDTALVLRALADTGHSLTYRGQGVVIGEKDAVEVIFKDPANDLRLLPYRSLGKKEGVLIGIKCDYGIVGSKRVDNIVLGMTDINLGDGVYNALINPELEV